MDTILVVISGITSIVAIAQFLWYGGRLPGFVLSLLGRVSWGKLERALLSLVEQVQSSGWRPDLVIGMARTGGIAAALLVENIRWLPPDVRLVILNYDSPPRDDKENVDLASQIQAIATHSARRILVVDSEMYSGRAVATVVRQLFDHGSRDMDVRTAVLFKFEPNRYNPAQLEPDFVGSKLGRRVMLPWVITEELKRAALDVMGRRWRRK